MADERDADTPRENDQESDGFSRDLAELIIAWIARGIWGLGALIVGVSQD